MPELPEVEVTRRGIVEPLRGARVLSVRLGKPLRWPLGVATQSLVGAVVRDVARRGKYLWIEFEGDAGGLLVHLGMSGSLRMLGRAPAAAGPHDHFEMQTTSGLLRLTDPRRFGSVLWSQSLAVDPAASLLARLGPEPFDPALTEQVFHHSLHSRRTHIKAVLLSGQAIVGAGNIYACEALFLAGIDPRTRCDRISRPRAARLLHALRSVLERAVVLGGSTLRDFRDVHGQDGAFQAEAQVYDRAGLPCRRCGAAVRRLLQGQRSSYFCPACQRR